MLFLSVKVRQDETGLFAQLGNLVENVSSTVEATLSVLSYCSERLVAIIHLSGPPILLVSVDRLLSMSP